MGHADQLKPTKVHVEEETDAGATPKENETSTPTSYLKNSQIDDSGDFEVEYREPKPPKVQMRDPNATPLELHAQIQLYATTE